MLFIYYADLLNVRWTFFQHLYAYQFLRKIFLTEIGSEWILHRKIEIFEWWLELRTIFHHLSHVLLSHFQMNKICPSYLHGVYDAMHYMHYASILWNAQIAIAFHNNNNNSTSQCKIIFTYFIHWAYANLLLLWTHNASINYFGQPVYNGIVSAYRKPIRNLQFAMLKIPNFAMGYFFFHMYIIVYYWLFAAFSIVFNRRLLINLASTLVDTQLKQSRLSL